MPDFFWRLRLSPGQRGHILWRFPFFSMVSKIVESVRELVEPIVTDHGLELVDVEHHRSPRGWVLRITIDKEGGVTLNDCTKLSRETGYILEIKELIGYPYQLEVTSPGLERPLKTPADFGKYIGRKVAIKTSILLRGRKNFKGTLQGAQGETVHLEIGGELWEIPFSTITQAKLIYEFPNKT